MMRITILSRAPQCYSTRRLVEAARNKGHKVLIQDPLRFAIDMEEGEPDLYYKNKPINIPDAVLPRIGTSITRYGTTVVRQFEQMDVYTPNTSSGIGNSRDKLRSLQILSRHDIGIPRTSYVSHKTDVSDAIERVGGTPVIIKLIEGTQGVGVILADKPEIAKAIVETLQAQTRMCCSRNLSPKAKGKMCVPLSSTTASSERFEGRLKGRSSAAMCIVEASRPVSSWSRLMKGQRSGLPKLWG